MLGLAEHSDVIRERRENVEELLDFVFDVGDAKLCFGPLEEQARVGAREDGHFDSDVRCDIFIRHRGFSRKVAGLESQGHQCGETSLLRRLCVWCSVCDELDGKARVE